MATDVATQTDSAAAPVAEPVIEAQSLTKVFRDFWGREKVRAVKALDLKVQPGEIFGLLGPNGSGKSTTIKMMLGLLFPTNGRVLVFGKDATDARKNDRIGYLPEESYLYKFLNAEETLDFYGRLFNMSAAKRRERTNELISLVKLEWARRRPLKEYSKGMTRRIGLAQALINDPDLVLLDEPTTGLDPLGTDDMKDMIIALKERGKTVVLCSHLLPDIQDICDRVAILYQGELKELGRLDELLSVKDETNIRIKGLSEEAQQELASIVARHGGEILQQSQATNSLKDLFLGIIRESEARPGKRISVDSTSSSSTSDNE